MQVKIVSPCPQDFTHIKIAMLSRQCDLCNKPVIDFTKMSREEIITYLLEHSDEKVCGRMNRPQVDIHHDDLPVIIETLKKQGGNRPFLLLALICMSLVSCSTPEPAESNIKVKQNPVRATQLEGEVAMTDTTKVQQPNQENRVSKVKVIPPEVLPSPEPSPEPYPVIEGDIAFIEEPILLPPPPAQEQEEILSYAEKMPEYPGGITEMFKFIQSNMIYPEIEKEAGIQGNVYVQFVVTKEGRVTSPKILKSVLNAPGFDKEALRVVNMMPDWIPGENGGKKVNVYFTIPIKFKLN